MANVHNSPHRALCSLQESGVILRQAVYVFRRLSVLVRSLPSTVCRYSIAPVVLSLYLF